MTNFVCINGTVITLVPTACTMTTTTFTVTASGDKLRVDGNKVVLELDMVNTMTGATSAYVTPTYTIPGSLSNATLDTGLTPSSIFRHETDGVILDNLAGNFTIGVQAPATMPPPASTPDSATSYGGTWSISNNGGNTKLKSN